MTSVNAIQNVVVSRLHTLQSCCKLDRRVALKSTGASSFTGHTGRLNTRTLRGKNTLTMPKTTSLFGGLRNALGGGSKTAGGPEVASDAYFSDNAPSWEMLSEMVAAQRIELGAPAPDKETVSGNSHHVRGSGCEKAFLVARC